MFGAWILAAALGQPVEPAPAEPLALQWITTAPDCPSQAAVRRGVEAYLGRATVNDPDAPVSAKIEVFRGDLKYTVRVTLTTESGTGMRTLDGMRCDVLADAAALMVAVTIDPSAASRDVDSGLTGDAAASQDDPDDDPGSAGGLEKDPSPPEAFALPAADPPPKRSRPGGALFVHGALSVGLLPGPAGRVGLGGALRLAHARVEIGAGYTFARDVVDEGDTVGRASAVGALVRGCGGAAVADDRLELWGCGGAEAGALLGEGRDILEARRAPVPFAAALVGALIHWVPIPRLAVFVRPELAVPLVRPALVVEGRGRVHRAAPVGFFGALGLEVRFL